MKSSLLSHVRFNEAEICIIFSRRQFCFAMKAIKIDTSDTARPTSSEKKEETQKNALDTHTYIQLLKNLTYIVLCRVCT